MKQNSNEAQYPNWAFPCDAYRMRDEVKFQWKNVPKEEEVYYLLEVLDMDSKANWKPICFDDGYDEIPYLSNLAEASHIVQEMRMRYKSMQLNWLLRLKEVKVKRIIEN